MSNGHRYFDPLIARRSIGYSSQYE
jgi:hypothetical protein